MRKVLFATCAIAVWLVVLASPGAAQTLPSVVLSETIRDAPGTIHVGAVVNVDADRIGGSCTVTVTGENNQSVHPNSDIIVSSANEVTVADVERAAGTVTTPADGALLLGDTITVRVRLGEDGVFSGGLLEVDFVCTPPPPPPTVVPQSVPPSATASTLPNVTVAAEVDERPTAGATLPRTGSSNTGELVAGIATLLVGLGLLAKAASTRRA